MPEGRAETQSDSGSPFGDPGDFFQSGQRHPGGDPFKIPGGGQGYGRGGHGMYGLPDAFTGWSAPARYAFGPSIGFAQKSQGALDYFKGEGERDYGKELFGMSSDITESQLTDAKRGQGQAMTRAGYGGGQMVSPFGAMQLQQEAEARSGALGMAARQSVFQAQQMRSGAYQNYQNLLSQVLQAMMQPAYLQQGGVARTPVAPGGPSPIGPALGAAGAFFGSGG